MDVLDTAFKAIAILHAALGIVGLVIGSMAFIEPPDGGVPQRYFYYGRSVRAGRTFKVVSYTGSLSLIACGAFSFFMPTVAVVAAWLSVVLYLLTSAVYAATGRRLPSYEWTSLVALSIRIAAAISLTWLVTRAYG